MTQQARSHRRKRAATYADIEAAPEHLIAEIVHGRLLTRSMPPPVECFVLTTLGTGLCSRYSHKSRNARFIICNKPELHLGPHVIVPSIAGWPIARFPRGLPESWFMVPSPQWVCEMVSPPAKGYELHAKLEIYAGAGVEHLWLVDARARTVDAYAIGHHGWWSRSAQLVEGQAISTPPFDTSPIPPDEIWPYGLLPSSSHA